MIGDLPIPHDLGPWALVAIFCLLVFTGRLVPRSTLDDVRRDRDVRVAEAREEAAEWQATAKVSAEQVSILLPELQTQTALLKALSPREPGGGP